MAKFSIEVDLGGTNLRMGAFTSGFERLQLIAIPTRVSCGPDAVSRDICDGIRQLLSDCSEYGELQGIGIGAPGPVELPADRFSEPPNLHLGATRGRPNGKILHRALVSHGAPTKRLTCAEASASSSNPQRCKQRVLPAVRAQMALPARRTSTSRWTISRRSIRHSTTRPRLATTFPKVPREDPALFLG